MIGGGRAFGRAALYALSALSAVVAVAAAAALLLPGLPDQGGGQEQSATAGQQEGQPEQQADVAGSNQAGQGGQEGHVHQWKVSETVVHVPEKSHVEKVAAPGRDIIEYHTVCDACGAYIDGEDAMAKHFQAFPSHAKSGYTTGEPVIVGQEAGSAEEIVVVDEAAHDEVVATKTCTVCGAVEQETEGR